MYEWVKAFHIIFMVTWFAALLYLPRLYVYHAMAKDEAGISRFKIMERKLFVGIMTPSAVLTIAFGLWLIAIRGLEWLSQAYWLHLKLVLVALLVGYHVYLGALLRWFARDENRHGHVFYRWLNEAPVIVLIGTVLLAELKPWAHI